jgi:hypothetical protein
MRGSRRSDEGCLSVCVLLRSSMRASSVKHARIDVYRTLQTVASALAPAFRRSTVPVIAHSGRCLGPCLVLPIVSRYGSPGDTLVLDGPVRLIGRRVGRCYAAKFGVRACSMQLLHDLRCRRSPDAGSDWRFAFFSEQILVASALPCLPHDCAAEKSTRDGFGKARRIERRTGARGQAQRAAPARDRASRGGNALAADTNIRRGRADSSVGVTRLSRRFSAATPPRRRSVR